MGLGALFVLTGCSLDTVIWGPDGAAVIDQTDRLIRAVSAGEGAPFLCEGASVDLRAPEHWKGLAAGEPEGFRADHWRDQAALSPTWSINLESGSATIVEGKVLPSDVFYRKTDAGLCVVDVVWATVESAG